MKYTLYIDESGDFETDRGEWVIAGILFSESYEKCESILKSKLGLFPNKVNLNSIEDFHLTELRMDLGHDDALNIANKLYETIDKLPFSYYGIASVNYTKSSLSEKEKTYRLMMSDLLAVCETVIPDDVDISRLDVVVASRTINGIKQTTISDIYRDVISSLPSAIEIDLAAKGLLDIMGKNIRVHMDYANNSWGLVCADFLANINYHYKKPDEKNLLSRLKDNGKFYRFESFGGTDVRRARVAERNGDYASAIQRWINIGKVKGLNDEADSAIRRLLDKLLLTMGTTGYKIGFDSLLDSLWRSNNSVDKYFDLCLKLEYLDSSLADFLKVHSSEIFDALSFRLKNLLLIVLNHLGQTEKALKIIEKQRVIAPKLALNPENFYLVLNFKVSETESYINSLDLTSALNLAKNYSNLLDNYRELWQLFLMEDNLIGFESSSVFIKSGMSLFRILTLSINVIDIGSIDTIENKAFYLQSLVTHKLDKSRLNNYLVMFYLKNNSHADALRLAISNMEDKDNTPSLYDFHWFMRAINDSLLRSLDIDFNSSSAIIEKSISNFDLNNFGHPTDVLLRELALYEFHTGNTSKAKKYILKSKSMADQGNAEIFKFLREACKIHEDYIFGKSLDEKSYFKGIDNQIVNAIYNSNLNLSFFEKVRYFSFY